MSTPSTELETIPKGQLSKALETRLKAVGKDVTAESILQQAGLVRKRQTDFHRDCLVFGIMLLARKSALPHGKWGAEESKLADSANLKTRTIREYSYLAKQFLSHLEAGDFREELAELGASKVDAESITSLSCDTAQPIVLDQLTAFIGGRSLDRMLKDFRAAEKAATESEEAEERKATGEDKPKGQSPEQMVFDFKERLFEKLNEYDRALRANVEVVSFMKDEDWQAIRDWHIAQAEEIKRKMRHQKS